jgi:hypothetical protein
VVGVIVYGILLVVLVLNSHPDNAAMLMRAC